MKRPSRVEAGALVFLAVAFVVVVAWTSTWPVAPLIPDEAIAKTMADSMRARGTPLPREPFEDYPNGAFVVERYGGNYRDHEMVEPPVSIAIGIEQGLLPPQIGRAITLGVGLVALAYLAWRMEGPYAAVLAGSIYLTHPAILYFHQSYFANSGGAAWFLATLALLEAGRERAAFAALAVISLAITLVYRIEYGVGFLAVLLLAPSVGPLRRARSFVVFFALVILGGVLLVWGAGSVIPANVLFADGADIRQATLHPFEAVRARLNEYLHRDEVVKWGQEAFAGHTRDYFLWFFPLTLALALVGIFTRPRRTASTWVFAPIAIQSLVAGIAVLPVLVNFDFSNRSWLESSVVRYFLPLYATAALLASLPLARAVEVLTGGSSRRAFVATGALVGCIAIAGIVQAIEAEHGVKWANERRQWFNDIERAAEAFGENAVFVGVQPSKVIFSRPVLSPANLGYDGASLAQITRNLTERGYEVYGLDPWFHSDAGPYDVARAALGDGHFYWVATGVTIECACGESAHFWKLEATNATLVNVERLDSRAWTETSVGLVSAKAPRAFFWPVRDLHTALGGGAAPPLRVGIEVLDEVSGRPFAAGYVNVPTEIRENIHVGTQWTGTGSGDWVGISFDIPAGAVVNGPFFVSDGWMIRVLKVETTQ